MYLSLNEPISKTTNKLEMQYDHRKHEYDPKKKTTNTFMTKLQRRIVTNDTRNQRVNMLRMLHKKYDCL